MSKKKLQSIKNTLHPLMGLIDDVLKNISTTERALHVSYIFNYKQAGLAHAKVKEYLKRNKIKPNTRVDYDTLHEIKYMIREAYDAKLASGIIPSSLFITLIVYFEKYTKDLVWALYRIKPEIFNIDSKTVSIKDVKEKGLREMEIISVNEKINNIFKDNRLDFFDWYDLHHKSQVKNEQIYKKFIELSAMCCWPRRK